MKDQIFEIANAAQVTYMSIPSNCFDEVMFSFYILMGYVDLDDPKRGTSFSLPPLSPLPKTLMKANKGML